MNLTGATWHTSSYSQTDGQCVEVTDSLPDIVAVRDSKDPAGPTIVVSPDHWRTFITAIQLNTFTR
ncbi:MAG: DUF397 domain-containing protein [Micromonosporaceae bacterium]|nr:DUF397 domain-containing protein [Micromonosporaceae bacterium]